MHYTPYKMKYDKSANRKSRANLSLPKYIYRKILQSGNVRCSICLQTVSVEMSATNYRCKSCDNIRSKQWNEKPGNRERRRLYKVEYSIRKKQERLAAKELLNGKEIN
jgi:hypothetical protein